MLDYISKGQICYGCMSALPGNVNYCNKCGKKLSTLKNESHQLPIGTILAGRYLIGKALGQGGFGITYIGYNLQTNQKLAIKECFPQGVASRTHTAFDFVTTSEGDPRVWFEKTKQRFLEEAKSLVSFSHIPSVVNIRDYFLENGTAYLVMDYVEGKTIWTLAKQNGGKLPAGTVLKYLLPIMKALSEIHSKGILHRDIAPDNIMVRSSDNTAVLLDFGAARQMSAEGEHTNTIQVKHGYAPEEQYRTHGKQGPWTDIYALCATIYKLTTGETPTQAIDRLAGNTPLKPPNELGASFTKSQQAALMKGLSLYGKDRQQSMNQLIKELMPAAKLDTKPEKDSKLITVQETKPKAEKDIKPKTEQKSEDKPVISRVYPHPVTLYTLTGINIGLLILSFFRPLAGIIALIIICPISVIVCKRYGLHYAPYKSGVCITDYSSSMKTLTIPGKIAGKPVLAIATNAFSGKDIKKISLPSSIRLIDRQAFSLCPALKSISIPNSVEIIGDSAFEGCTSISQFRLPSALSHIGSKAFAGCSSISIQEIPCSVQSIGKDAFLGCKSINMN